jgi:hypothetical protein
MAGSKPAQLHNRITTITSLKNSEQQV